LTPRANIKTQFGTTPTLTFQGYDTAWRDVIQLKNHASACHIDILRGGDITMLAQKYITIGVFTDANRGAAGTAGRMIFNTDDGMPNYDDGTDWRDINGNIT